MSMGRQNVTDKQVVVNYMRTTPTHYYIESSGRAAYMETHPKPSPI